MCDNADWLIVKAALVLTAAIGLGDNVVALRQCKAALHAMTSYL